MSAPPSPSKTNLRPGELAIEMVLINDLKPASYNPRRSLTDLEARQLAASLQRFGAVDPAVINTDNTIIGGHQRIGVAADLGWETFPCVRVHLSPSAERQLNLALNKIQGDWDQQLLAELLEELATFEDIDLDSIGFDQGELDDLAASLRSTMGLVDPDVVPEVPEVVVTRPGDVWLLGDDHRLMCGDATSASDVQRLLGGASPDLMITDPPYGVNYEPAWRSEEAAKGTLSHGAARTKAVPNDDRCDWQGAWDLAPSSVAYIWHAGLHAGQVQHSLEQAGYVLRAQIIWAKQHLPISRGAYHWRHEPCFYAVAKGARANWIGDRKQTTVWDDIPLDPNVQGGHSTQKPVEAMARAVRNHRGDVYDPFVGTGTTLIAAVMSGRRSFCMDITPAFVDVARLRWEAFAGKRAKLEKGGK